MKNIKWKILILTSVISLLPILFGVALWDKLPEMIAIHFDINGNPDNYTSKGLAVFGLPALMAILQVVCCVFNDFEINLYRKKNKIEKISKWIIPVMSVILQAVTLGYAIGWNVDVKKVAMAFIGIIFILTGSYMRKMDYVKNYNIEKEKAKKINRFIGVETIVMGIVFLLSIFLPPITTFFTLLLLIPYSLIAMICILIVSKK